MFPYGISSIIHQLIRNKIQLNKKIEREKNYLMKHCQYWLWAVWLLQAFYRRYMSTKTPVPNAAFVTNQHPSTNGGPRGIGFTTISTDVCVRRWQIQFGFATR